MIINMIGSFQRNAPFGTEIAFAKGLKQLGIGVNTWDPSREELTVDTLNDNAAATIIFKDHGRVSHSALLVRKVLGQITIEYQPDDIRAKGIRGMMGDMRQYCDYAFTFDETGAKVAKEELGYKKAMKLLVTADPELYRPLGLEKKHDFCFVGSMSNPESHASRREMITILKSAGYDITSAQDMFDPYEINRMYNSSKVVINHATDMGQEFGTGYGYQCRHFEAGMAGACLLSNSLLDEEPDGPQQFVKFDSRTDLLAAAEDLINGWYNGAIYERQGTELYNEMMTSHQPVHRAQQIVDFINGIKDEAL